MGSGPWGRIRAAGGDGETVATKRQVELKLRELLGRMDRMGDGLRGSLAEALPETRIVELDVPDISATFWTELDGGRLRGLHLGAPQEAHIKVRVGSDHLVELVDGQTSLFSSFLGGQVKVEASFWDLLRLRKLA